jgi:hypothetical protein
VEETLKKLEKLKKVEADRALAKLNWMKKQSNNARVDDGEFGASDGDVGIEMRVLLSV